MAHGTRHVCYIDGSAMYLMSVIVLVVLAAVVASSSSSYGQPLATSLWRPASRGQPLATAMGRRWGSGSTTTLVVAIAPLPALRRWGRIHDEHSNAIAIRDDPVVLPMIADGFVPPEDKNVSERDLKRLQAEHNVRGMGD